MLGPILYSKLGFKLFFPNVSEKNKIWNYEIKISFQTKDLTNMFSLKITSMKEYLFLDNFHHCGFNWCFIDDDGTAHKMLRRKKVKKTS